MKVINFLEIGLLLGILFPGTFLVAGQDGIPNFRHGLVYIENGDVVGAVYALEDYSPLGIDGENAEIQMEIIEAYSRILNRQETKFNIFWLDNYPLENKAIMMRFFHQFSVEGGVPQRVENEGAGSGRLFTLKIPLSGTPYDVGIFTNSFLDGTKFVNENRRLYIKVGGGVENYGTLIVGINREFCQPEDLKVYIDNQLVEPEPEIWPGPEYDYAVLITFGLSSHLCVLDFGAIPAWYAQPLNLALLALAVVIAIGAAYWFKFRR